MSFGFPAWHTESVSARIPPSFRNLLDKTIRSLGWLIVDETEDSMTASTGLNILSWGERVTIRHNSLGYTVSSRCVLVTQCFDWGKNKANVRKLIAEIHQQI